MTDPDQLSDRQRVAELLGREPQGEFEVVVRDEAGDPVVIRNSPLLADGTPMPTRYWLVAPDENRRIGTLEASGGVNAAEADIDPGELAEAHLRYAAERDTAIDPDYGGPRPSGGVGGTRVGVKCLHAHWAWHLAGGDDPVGRWIEGKLEPSTPSAPPSGAAENDEMGDEKIDGRLAGLMAEGSTAIIIGSASTTVHTPDRPFELGWGVTNLADRWLTDDDPPRPEDLTNALGAVDDDLDDLDRELGPIGGPVAVGGSPAGSIARLEIGAAEVPQQHLVDRADLEEIFRMVATEPIEQRRTNPGLVGDDAQVVLPALCIALAITRRYRLPEVRLVELR